MFYDSQLSYAQFRREAEALAGFLQQRCGVRKGDRVLLDMQNSPQFMLAYYAILRADAVVVPVSPMNVTDELEHYVADSGARTALVAQDVYAQFRPLLGHGLEHVMVATYADYLTAPTALEVPELLTAPRDTFSDPGVIGWHDALAAACAAAPPAAGCDDLAAILYTSGTTGKPKGCMHTHHTIMCTAVGGALWEGMAADSVVLATAPMFHVTGMQHSLNAPIFAGATHRAAAALGSGGGRLHDRALRRAPTGPMCRPWWSICSPTRTPPDATCPRCRTSSAAGRPCPKRWRRSSSSCAASSTWKPTG